MARSCTETFCHRQTKAVDSKSLENAIGLLLRVATYYYRLERDGILPSLCGGLLVLPCRDDDDDDDPIPPSRPRPAPSRMQGKAARRRRTTEGFLEDVSADPFVGFRGLHEPPLSITNKPESGGIG
jgi:hypothetical protein